MLQPILKQLHIGEDAEAEDSAIIGGVFCGRRFGRGGLEMDSEAMVMEAITDKRRELIILRNIYIY